MKGFVNLIDAEECIIPDDFTIEFTSEVSETAEVMARLMFRKWFTENKQMINKNLLQEFLNQQTN